MFRIESKWSSETAHDAYGVIRVLKQPHGILDDDLIFEANELGDLFGNPRFDDLQIYFFHIHLRKEKRIRTLLDCKDANGALFCRILEGTSLS